MSRMRKIPIKCSVDNCLKNSVCKGLCGTHYTRYTRTGDPLKTKNFKYGSIKCAVDNCEAFARENKMCAKHAQRVRRYGDPHYVTSEEERRVRSRHSQPKLGKLQPQTYHKFLGRHAHRQIMEIKIGRALARNEVVHHIDGNKHNNHPDNLQLMTQSEHIKLHLKQQDMKRKNATP